MWSWLEFSREMEWQLSYRQFWWVDLKFLISYITGLGLPRSCLLVGQTPTLMRMKEPSLICRCSRDVVHKDSTGWNTKIILSIIFALSSVILYLRIPQVGFVDNQFGLELAICGKGSTNNECLGEERFDDLKQIQHGGILFDAAASYSFYILSQ